jgi:hypothetical protein
MLAWTLPETPVFGFFTAPVFSPLTANSAPLYARNCAFLI